MQSEKFLVVDAVQKIFSTSFVEVQYKKYLSKLSETFGVMCVIFRAYFCCVIVGGYWKLLGDIGNCWGILGIVGKYLVNDNLFNNQLLIEELLGLSWVELGNIRNCWSGLVNIGEGWDYLVLLIISCWFTVKILLETS